MTIQSLPIEVVHLIAAGEVIDSLAAVVRELVENAVDAAATRITVSVWADQWRVQVADNGRGMTLEDLQQAASPHSTSKIHDRHDLWRIQSLGFRGEALHSLAQLSQLAILSRSTDRDQGWHLVYDSQGGVASLTSAAIAPGTIVIVDQLFAPWPARREGLPSAAQQLRAIQNTIHQIALCHPQVTWQVNQGDRRWFTLWASPTAKQRLPQILRDVQITDLQELQIPLAQEQAADPAASVLCPDRDAADCHPLPAAAKLYLVLGLPDRCHRRRPDWIRVALNGRLVNLPELERTILSAFQRTLPRDRYPICFVHLHLRPEHIDWNRHPAKAEVYLHHLSHWQTQVSQAIQQALALNPDRQSEGFYNHRVSQLLKVAEAGAGYDIDRQITPTPSAPSASTTLKAIAQVHQRYILAEHPAGLWLIEQHIAHERVLYEQLCDRWQLTPLSPALLLHQLSTRQVEQLQRLELDIESFGDQLWTVRSAPALLAQRPDCAAALWELSLGGDLRSAQVATACRSAIRNGIPLTLPEMQTLLDQWQCTRQPRTCPHGRPIYLALEESELARFFRRHWVIGKSHGLEATGPVACTDDPKIQS